MPTQIFLTVGKVTLKGELYDTPTANAVKRILPLEEEFSTWGEEIYFNVPLKMSLDESAKQEVEIGDIGYWPPGPAIAIFFGPTPLSSGSKPVAASSVNIIGKIKEDPTPLSRVKTAKKIKIYLREPKSTA
jgi:hypothetical protein